MTRFLLWPIWILQLFGGAKSFVGNPLLGSATLNGWGLHTTRVRLAHAATQLRWWLLAPLAAAELRQRFRTQGYLVLENYLPLADFERLKVAIETCRAEVREMRQGDTLTLRCSTMTPSSPSSHCRHAARCLHARSSSTSCAIVLRRCAGRTFTCSASSTEPATIRRRICMPTPFIRP